jgi:tetratricopeptide (TPR) repeat protein
VSLPWKPSLSIVGASLTAAALGLAAFITQRAVESERLIVSATRTALSISASGSPNDPRWQPAKSRMLEQIRDGIALNPHYRKITPIVADELGRWGDWKNAVWIWESVLSSRPHIVAIIANVSRGYMVTGDLAKARMWLERARAIQPAAASVRSLDVLLLARTHQEARALELAKEALEANVFDFDIANTAFALAWRAGDYATANKAMELRMKGWPDTQAFGLVQLGNMYATSVKDPAQALSLFRRAKAMVSPADWMRMADQVPPEFRARIGDAASPPPPQMSASKG